MLTSLLFAGRAREHSSVAKTDLEVPDLPNSEQDYVLERKEDLSTE